MKQPFHFRDLFKRAQNEIRLGQPGSLTARMHGFKDVDELGAAARQEEIDSKPRRLGDAEKEAARLSQIAAEADADAIAMRDEVEEARIELERNLRNLAQEEDVLSRLQSDIAATPGAIAERIAQLTEPFFVSQTYIDNTGQQIALENNILDAIARLRLRQEFYPAQLAGVKAKVEELRKLIK
jgi:hypothetical protein